MDTDVHVAGTAAGCVDVFFGQQEGSFFMNKLTALVAAAVIGCSVQTASADSLLGLGKLPVVGSLDLGILDLGSLKLTKLPVVGGVGLGGLKLTKLPLIGKGGLGSLPGLGG